MATLNVDPSYIDHIKVIRLKAALGIDTADAYPIRLWSKAALLCPETGAFTGFGERELEALLGWKGKTGQLVELLVAFNFLDKRKKGYQIHNWKIHASHLIAFKKRAITAAKARWKGDAKKRTSNASSMICTDMSVRRKKREKKTEPELPVVGKLSAQALIEKYNKETPDTCPAVIKVTPARLKKAKDYLAIFPDEKFWTDVFLEYHKSKFLSCMVPSKDGHKGFEPDFDWLLSKGKSDQIENVVKVFEGKYR
jgi:hypothetical protein